MKGKKRRTPQQIVRLLEEVDARFNAGQSLAQVCQQLEIAESTFHRWRNQYGGMKSEEAKRLVELEKENARLKKLVGELTLDKEMLKELARGNF